VRYLTRQEQFMLYVTIALLLFGWAVKVYRIAHPLAAPALVRVRP